MTTLLHPSVMIQQLDALCGVFQDFQDFLIRLNPPEMISSQENQIDLLTLAEALKIEDLNISLEDFESFALLQAGIRHWNSLNRDGKKHLISSISRRLSVSADWIESYICRLSSEGEPDDDFVAAHLDASAEEWDDEPVEDGGDDPADFELGDQNDED